MNRQTLAVIVGTIALVVVGAVLMYGSPGTQSPPVTAQGGAKAKVKAKADKADKAEKADKAKSPRKLQDAKLVHAGEIPADRPAAPAGSPNVVLFVLSTQRRDQWTVYGGPDGTTPFLAKQGATGVVMMDALSVAVDPRPSDAAIITGRYPHGLGVIEPADKRNNNPITADADTLAERLAAAGWFTVGLSANHNLNEKAGGAQGFDWYRDSQPYSLMTDQRIDAAELASKAVERVSSRTEAEKARPMFLQLAFVDSHKPIKIPPAEFKPFSGNGEVAPYRATIRRQDDAIQKVVEGLAAQGVTAENTVFVVIADHGEGLDMPEAHRKQHGFVLYESSVRIPWVMWGKGLAARKVDGLASQIDLAPTVAALAGLKEQTGFDGLDLSAAVLGTGPSPRTEAYADTLYEGANRASIWTSAHQCQKDFGSKDIENDQFEDGCYDRKADPVFTKTIEDAALAAKLEKQRQDLMGKVGG
ncbi:MAG: sulfatase [Myxococcota bacterium]